LVVGFVVVGFYWAYRAALPKPLKGIPYNRNAIDKLFGDVPEMIGYVMRTKRIFVSAKAAGSSAKIPPPRNIPVLTRRQCWLTSLTSRHQSPIIQAFVQPMGLPWVVVTDPYESQDILLRRTKEFDRSGFFGDLIGGILPEQHIQFISSDDRFKKNRNLINHLMAPTFITQVLGPSLYKAVSTMIKMWELKCSMAEGRPFLAHHDITYMALDTIFMAMFGHPEADSNTTRRLQAVSQLSDLKLPASADEPVEFPEGDIPDIFSAALTLANSVTDTQLSPAPRLTSWIIRKFPYMRKATAIKDQYIRDKVDESLRKINSGDEDPRTALHSVLLRERDVAGKEGRKPDYFKRGIADEFFGFMLAGHDTSATTVAWGVKFLADHPAAQDRLRAELRAALPDAALAKRAPTYPELARAHIPYLDAVVEEVLRHANTIAFVVRRAQQDTTVLGRPIPKGTDVFLMANGAGYLEPNMRLSDAERSPGARRSDSSSSSKTALTGLWDDADISAFKPERWLKTDPETGAEVFDAMAGPQLAFGLGPRACFGKRFALQGLKIQFALIVWHFHLHQTPKELSGYDAVQRFAREPTQCFVRLSNANL
jgi:cytochrome P450